MNWSRGKLIGRGSFGSVYLGIKSNQFDSFNSLMAVKSCSAANSTSLHHEKTILDQLRDCPQILTCYGHDYTVENGERLYNLHLELASRGSLAQLIQHSGGSFPESDVRRYTRSILLGLHSIHQKGFAHCDIKPHNILLTGESGQVKIADFGLAKKISDSTNSIELPNFADFGFGGTPMYMAPESIVRDDRGGSSACDVWALGCVVAEMISGRPVWRFNDSEASALLFKIGFSDELPEIPEQLSEEGRDFLKRCFVRDPRRRWTAEMLLNHQFVVGSNGTESGSKNVSPSPRSAFEFSEWVSSPRSACFDSDRWDCERFDGSDRIEELRTWNVPSWSETESWITVREAESDIAGKASSRKSADVNEDKEMVTPVFRANLEKQVAKEGGEKWNSMTDEVRNICISLFCLAILGTKKSLLSILGNYQQQNFHVLYDTKNSRLGYAPMKYADIF
ncbi:hypothetical protein Sjap_017283 [Stephania japonica]|uniref:Protein kinase domain-containing protein n=1 Tax=Stephania japonica TaxID=461633 RepID=A0AAP0NJ89_9MAGN